MSINYYLQVWFQNRRAKFRRNERNLLTQRHQTSGNSGTTTLYQADSPPLGMDPTTAAAAAAAAAVQARMNPGLYRSSVDYWTSPSSVYSPYPTPSSGGFDSSAYCLRQTPSGGAPMSSCALYGQQSQMASPSGVVGVPRYHEGISGSGLLRAGGYQPDSW